MFAEFEDSAKRLTNLKRLLFASFLLRYTDICYVPEKHRTALNAFSGLSLILVGLYSLIFFYVFALLGFAFLRHDISTTTGMFCDTMWKCYLSVIHRGLVSGFQDGAFSTVPTGFSYTYYVGIMFYQVTGFILITTIGLNIVFGIIVDTFSELRDSKASFFEVLMSYMYVHPPIGSTGIVHGKFIP